MWLLGCIFPLIVGDCISEGDDHWLLFLRIMEIVDLLFSPRITEDHAAYLSALISDHHHDFCRLYPDHTILPKQHFMIHTSRLAVK